MKAKVRPALMADLRRRQRLIQEDHKYMLESGRQPCCDGIRWVVIHPRDLVQ